MNILKFTSQGMNFESEVKIASIESYGYSTFTPKVTVSAHLSD